MQVICILTKDNDRILDFVNSCFRFPANLAWSNEAIFLEFLRYLSEKELEKVLLELEDLSEQMQLQTKITVAEDAATAISYAQLGTMEKEMLPIESLRYYYSPYNTSEKISRLISELKKLGIRSLKDLEHLSPSTIYFAFDKDFLHAMNQVKKSQQKTKTENRTSISYPAQRNTLYPTPTRPTFSTNRFTNRPPYFAPQRKELALSKR